ncbi:MAG: NAD-dependent epimerase/dehydratase family protein [Candidatus Omnitrophica bacterium]|nr:NAD-dependent epimerase/dehydratase family protein [Candidatus Omnitrophota bacterium]
MKEYNKKIEFIPSINLKKTNSISDAFDAINGRFKVMNAKPVVLTIENLKDDMKRTHAVNQIYNELGPWGTIPVLDKKGRVIGLAVPEMLQAYDMNPGAQDLLRSKSPQVLVVGGAGYIGSVLVSMLLEKGWRARVLDNMLYKQTSLDKIKNKHLSVMRRDVANINDVLAAIEGIDAVVYLAEIVGDPACAYTPERALKTNYLSVANMAHLCSYLNINRFIYASSCSVYGGSPNPDFFLTENSELNPISYYGRMKIMAEQVTLGISNPLFAPTILRLATVFGHSYRPRFDLVVNTFAKNAFFQKYIEVFGGEQWRPNVHVRDVASAIIKILEAPLDKVSRQIFNVGSKQGNHTISELAGMAEEIFPGISIRQQGQSKDPRNYKVDFTKIENALGYKAGTSVRDGLMELRDVFERGEISDPEDSRYSNIKAIKEIMSK